MGPREGSGKSGEAQGQLRTARDVFRDLHALDELDDKADYGEERFNLIGVTENRLLVVTYTLRSHEANGDEIIRIISARPAERRETRKYREG